MSNLKIFIEPEFQSFYEKYPIGLIDVGASGDLQKNWKPAQKHLYTFAFEPDEKAYSDLVEKSNGNSRIFNTALYSIESEVVYYLTRKQECSSIFKPNRDFLSKFAQEERFDIIDSKELKVNSLDNVLKDQKDHNMDFLKVDTEGAELYVLQGSTQTMKDHIFGLEVEVGFTEIRDSQPLFHEVDSFIQAKGFTLFDLQGSYWKRKEGMRFGENKGQLILGNALYFKKPSSFKECVQRISDPAQRRAKILNALAICALYGYYDYALEILSISKEFLEKNDHLTIEKWISQNISFSSKIPNFRGKGKFSGIFYSLWKLFKPTTGGWASSDWQMGNRNYNYK